RTALAGKDEPDGRTWVKARAVALLLALHAQHRVATDRVKARQLATLGATALKLSEACEKADFSAAAKLTNGLSPAPDAHPPANLDWKPAEDHLAFTVAQSVFLRDGRGGLDLHGELLAGAAAGRKPKPEEFDRI